MKAATQTLSPSDCLLRLYDEQHEIEDYQKGVPRWCTGCGDNAILTAVQRLCRDEGLLPEKTVFVSGIGCSSRLPATKGFFRKRRSSFRASAAPAVCRIT